MEVLGKYQASCICNVNLRCHCFDKHILGAKAGTRQPLVKYLLWLAIPAQGLMAITNLHNSPTQSLYAG